ncbi:MAG TPA: GNAT family N-acetyltransferase, partial [Verrucomicrobiales bacterium]|nr:GNAT family N-acetyltransferase [Verrucomicrobiales bacterium]
MSLSLSNKVNVIKVQTKKDRDRAISVLKRTYDQEKHWIYDADDFFPEEDLERDDISWFVSQVKDEPVGVLRVMYNPPLELYKEYGFKQLDSGLDVEAFVNENKIAEIGRFAV